MHDDTGFFPPVGYSLWWPLLGAALLMLLAGWYGYIFLSTRARTPVAVPAFIPPRDGSSVKGKYLAVIDAVAQRHGRGELTARVAHQELSLAIRSFVHEMTGVEAQRMTLAELRARQLPTVADAVAGFYPAEFGRPDPTGLGNSVETARFVVMSWN